VELSVDTGLNYGEVSDNPSGTESDRMANEVVAAPPASGWEEVTATLTAYLAACGISDETKAVDLIREIKHRMAVRLPVHAHEPLAAVALEEAEKLMDCCIMQTLGLKYSPSQEQLFAARVAVLSDLASWGWTNGHEVASGSQAEALRAAILVPLPPRNELPMETQTLELGYWKLRSFLKYKLRRLTHYFRRCE
jgi:hypothetical protein